MSLGSSRVVLIGDLGLGNRRVTLKKEWDNDSGPAGPKIQSRQGQWSGNDKATAGLQLDRSPAGRVTFQ
jgi:hypothetical protein